MCFTAPLSASPRPLSRSRPSLSPLQPARPLVARAPLRRRRAPAAMRDPPGGGGFSFGGFGSGALFESPIVRAEVERLERDQAALSEMGRRYGQFDYAGKVAYVDEMEACMERWLILLARFRLDDGFECRRYVARLTAELAKYGMTVEGLTEKSRESFEEMRREARREHGRD